VLGTLSFWLREAGIDRTTIGYLSWVGLAYAFKWVWSPLVDRLPLPVLNGWLGRRRSWLLLAQMLVVGGLLGMAFTDPQQDLSRWSGARWLVALARPRRILRWMPTASNRPTPSARRRWPPPTRRATAWP
jgi:hypothetical protein